MEYLWIIAVLATLCNTVLSRSWYGIVPSTHDHSYHNGYASDHDRHWDNGPQGRYFPDHEHYPPDWNDFDDSSKFSKDQSGWTNWYEDNWASLHGDNEFVTPRIPVPTSTLPSTNEITTRSVLTILLCIRACPVTPEYNPVCGTNNITYNNLGKLGCAKNCGVDVALGRSSPCPRTTNNPNSSNTTATTMSTPTNSTVAPVKPTRYTTIDISSIDNGKPDRTDCESSEETKVDTDSRDSGFTISHDILASIFENTPKTGETVAPEFSFDLRIKDDRYIFS